MATRNDLRKYDDFASEQGKFEGNHIHFADGHGDFAANRTNFADEQRTLPNRQRSFAGEGKHIAGKQRNFAKEKAEAVGKQGIFFRLGSWKRVIFMAIIFIWVAVGCFVTFKALNTTTIVTEDPQTVSAIYEETQASYNETVALVPAATSVPAVWLVK